LTRFITIVPLFLIFIAAALPLAAQDDPSPPTEQPLITDAADAALRAETAADRAEAALLEAEETLADAENAVGYASDLFGLFEAMSGVVGIVVPVLAIAAAVFGFNRLQNAEYELREAREKFEEEIAERNVELDRLNSELRETARQQREASASASLALALLQLGERQYRAQDYQGALDTYQRALELDDRNPITHYRMGYVYVHSDRFDEAEERLRQSLDLDSDFMPAQAALGYTYRRKGDKLEAGIERDLMYNRAEENFLKALKAFPKLIDEDGESWWGSLGGLYRRRGQIDQAICAYRKCADAMPRSSYAFSNLALLYGQKGQIDDMVHTYATVEKLAYGEVQADVDNYWAYTDLITARLAQGKIKETYDVLETALNVAPIDSPYTLQALDDTLARLMDILGTQEARENIEPVSEIVERRRIERGDIPADPQEAVETTQG
jgi:tetratricopeptide (TPR) repeat protein